MKLKVSEPLSRFADAIKEKTRRLQGRKGRKLNNYKARQSGAQKNNYNNNNKSRTDRS